MIFAPRRINIRKFFVSLLAISVIPIDDHEIEIDPRTHRYDNREPEQQEDEDQEIEKQIE